MTEELTKSQEEQIKKEVEKQVSIEKKRLSKQVLEKTAALGSEFKKQITTALITAFGLVIALSWQTVVKKIMDDAVPKSGILLYHPYLSDVYTAIAITALSAIAIMIISRWARTPS